jgi:cobalt-zinc-cadmium efflux system membrane fusion protein
MKKRLIITVAVVASIATLGAYALSRPIWPWSKRAAVDAVDQKGAQEEARTEVVLTPEKFATLKLSYAEVARHSLQSVRTVPGKLEYRSVLSVEIKAPVDLVVQRVLVKPGALVEPGTKLAILTSPDVGTARAEVEKSESELKIANQAFEWTHEITRNLNELLQLLKDRPSFDSVEQAFDAKLLGNHRHDILPAYSKYIAAEKLHISAEKLFERAAISNQQRVQAVSSSEMAWAQYQSVCEQSRFDARQAREKALQNQTYARRLRDVRRRELKTLLGDYGQSSEFSSSNDASPENHPDNGAELTRFYLIAPLAGTVERRSTADSQRVDAGTPLFVVANTDTLEVRADVREGDWQAVSLAEGQMLKVVVSAVGEDREFDAKVDYVGRAVDAQTRAVPLVALLDNAKHEFKPGMFARIKIPSGTAEEELVVPAAAIRTHDRRDFVFVVDADDPRTFHRADVVVGRRNPDWVTISTGLSAGQRVVVEGAFVLKNELLLEQEED